MDFLSSVCVGFSFRTFLTVKDSLRILHTELLVPGSNTDFEAVLEEQIPAIGDPGE